MTASFPSPSSLSLGIDIGGTFTDIVLYSYEDGRVFSHKELTTSHEPTEGTIRGIRILLERERISGDCVSRVIHATTLFANALIERRGAKTGLITTGGFRDTLEMRREFKYDLYDLFIELPEALIPRELRLEVAERMGAGGARETPLDENDVRRPAAPSPTRASSRWPSCSSMPTRTLPMSAGRAICSSGIIRSSMCRSPARSPRRFANTSAAPPRR